MIYKYHLCYSLTSVTSYIEEPCNNDIFNDISDECVLYVTVGTRDAYIAAGWTEEVFKGGIVEGDPEFIINFADDNVKALCVENWDTNDDGELSIAEAAAVTDLDEVFKGKAKITSFNELQYFTGLTSIGVSDFAECSGLTSIIIPSSVTSIGCDAFDACGSLTSITIPEGVTSIESYAFGDCPSLTSIQVESGNTVYDSRDNCNAIIETATNTLITGCKNTVIPSGVTSIGDGAFYSCGGLASIDIPEGVTRIGMQAFMYCYNLSSVTFPSSLTSIGDDAFSYCYNLSSVTFPSSLTSIGDDAFYYTGLTSIIIPSSVTSIEDCAFDSCSGLTSIQVESGNTVYDSRDNCNAIIETATNTLIAGCKNTVIPSSVTTIEEHAFSGCSHLTSIIIPEGVTSIGFQAFSNCSHLTSITIPSGMTSIEGWAFYYCSSLTSVISYIEPPFVLKDGAFSWVSDKCTLYVPFGTREAYIAAGWTEEVFKGGVVEMEPTDIEPILMTQQDSKDKNDKVFNLQGQRLGRMQRGVNIVKGKKILVK